MAPPTTLPSSLKDFLIPTHSESELNDTFARAVTAIRKHMRMDIAFLSEFTNGRRVFRAVDARVPTSVHVGGSDHLEDTYCQRVVDGRLPQLVTNAKALPAAMALPVTAALPVGAHLSVPVKLADGFVYGTFCCFSSTPDQTLTDRDLDVMRVFADWIGAALDIQREGQRGHREARERIERLIAGGSITSVYQAIYSLHSKTISGFECLSRISAEPKRGPDMWFREAATVGLGNELELKTIEAAVRALRKLPSNVYLSVNASPTLFRAPGFQALLDELPAHRVVLELTEHETIGEYRDLVKALVWLKQRGFRIAVDDAGAGYSSFRHILEIMPAFIKLDISLTRAIDSDPVRRALAAAMVRFAADTGSSIVAEGIETDAELGTLRDLGVTAGQGYFLQRPQPLEAALSLLECGATTAI